MSTTSQFISSDGLESDNGNIVVQESLGIPSPYPCFAETGPVL